MSRYSLKNSVPTNLELKETVNKILGRNEEKTIKREFGIRKALRMMNRQLEKVADFFGNITDI